VEIVPNAGWAFANLGCALLRAKDYKGAILRLKRAVQLGTKNSFTRELNGAKEMLGKRPKE
jgi:Flp pilus assembly protein TadD